MNASKENAREAIRRVALCNSTPSNDMGFVRDFLAAAERKLPTEAAYKRDKARRRLVADGLAATRRGV